MFTDCPDAGSPNLCPEVITKNANLQKRVFIFNSVLIYFVGSCNSRPLFGFHKWQQQEKESILLWWINLVALVIGYILEQHVKTWKSYKK